MEIPANSKTIINQAVRGDWFFLTKRTDMSPLPVWLKMKANITNKVVKEIYGNYIPWAAFWYNNVGEYYIHGDEHRRAVLKATQLLYSYKKAKKYLLGIAGLCEDARKAAKEFYNPNWSKYNDKQLLETYLNIVQLYTLSYIHGFVTWCNQVLQSNAKEIIGKYKKELLKHEITTDEALGILIMSDLPNLYREKELALDKLSKAYRACLKEAKNKKYIISKFSELNEKIELFLDKFKWIGYEYDGPVMSYNEVVKEIAQREQGRIRTRSKQSLIKLCKFTKKEMEVFETMALLSYTKDERNISDDFIHYCFNNLYNEIARRHKLSISDVKYLWDIELEDLLKGKDKFTKNYLKKKKLFCAAVSMPEKNRIKSYYEVGKKAKLLRDKIYNSSYQVENTSSKILKGTIASTGIATGKAKLIHTYADINKVKKGNILVAYMTSQKFMSAIMRSGAIVTNEGGLTCHAAIVAREINKPCVIGTKVAMEIIKDGDIVEVDANQGVVKILKKK